MSVDLSHTANPILYRLQIDLFLANGDNVIVCSVPGWPGVGLVGVTGTLRSKNQSEYNIPIQPKLGSKTGTPIWQHPTPRLLVECYQERVCYCDQLGVAQTSTLQMHFFI